MLDQSCERPLVTGYRPPDQSFIRSVIHRCQGWSVTRIAREGRGHFPVELKLLIGIENFPHVEDVAHGRFLQIAHARMHLVDRGTDFGPVFVLGFHCLGELGVGCARRGFEPCLFYRETRFERVEPLLLISREREFIVHELVQATLGIVVGPAIGGKRSEASGERRQQDREDKVKLLQRL